MLVGLSTPTVAQDRMVFKSLVDLDKCAANNRYDTGYCLEALQKYAKTHPKELFAIGKRARLQFNHWVALQFFEPALGAAPAAVKCADEDVRGSSYKNYTVYVPGTRNEIGMSYNEAESKTASAASFKK